MNVHEIVTEYLEENGYDGLYLPGEECRCFLCDLMPCSSPQDMCKPGHKVMQDDGDWVIVPRKGGPNDKPRKT